MFVFRHLFQKTDSNCGYENGVNLNAVFKGRCCITKHVFSFALGKMCI